MVIMVSIFMRIISLMTMTVMTVPLATCCLLVATTARVLEDPAPPYSVEERPTLRVLKSSQKSGSTRPLSGSTRPAEWLADESALRFIKKGSGIVSCWPFHQ